MLRLLLLVIIVAQHLGSMKIAPEYLVLFWSGVVWVTVNVLLQCVWCAHVVTAVHCWVDVARLALCSYGGRIHHLCDVEIGEPR